MGFLVFGRWSYNAGRVLWSLVAVLRKLRIRVATLRIGMKPFVDVPQSWGTLFLLSVAIEVAFCLKLIPTLPILFKDISIDHLYLYQDSIKMDTCCCSRLLVQPPCKSRISSA